MAVDTGRLLKVAVGHETTPGTIVAPQYGINHGDVTFKRVINKKVNEMSIGLMDKNLGLINIEKHAAGAIPGYLDAQTAGVLLTLMHQKRPDAPVTPGTSSGTGSTTLGYQHNFTRANTAGGPSLSIYRETDNYSEVSTLNRMPSVYMDFQSKDFGMFSADFVGKTPIPIANLPLSPSTITTATATAALADSGAASRSAGKFLNLARNDGVKFGIGTAFGTGTGGALSTSNLIIADYAKIMYANPVKTYTGIGTTEITNVVHNEGMMLSIECKLLFESNTYRQLWINNEGRHAQLEVVFETKANSVGATDVPSRMTIDMPNIKVHAWDDTQSLSDFVEQTFTFYGFYGAATNIPTFSATLVNNKSIQY